MLTKVLIFIAVAVAAKASTPSSYFVNYCDCLNNTEHYQNYYGRDVYLHKRKEDDFLQMLRDRLSEILGKLEREGRTDCGLETDIEHYVRAVAKICGLKMISEEYTTPPWGIEGNTKEYNCRFIVTHQPAVSMLIGSFKEVSLNCNYMVDLYESVDTIFAACERGCNC